MSVAALRVWTGPEPSVDISDRRQRLALNPILRAHLDQRHGEQQRLERYGSLLTHYRLTDLADAEVAVLPRSVELTAASDLDRFVSIAELAGLRTMVFGSHDLEPLMRSASIILLHPGPTRGAQPLADVLALPVFFTDRAAPLGESPASERPSVAFCGQGASALTASTVHGASRVVGRVVNRVRPRVVAPPALGHLALRAAALDRLRAHPGVDDHFVVRDRYRAGASSRDDRSRTQAEFDDNLRSAQYALCVRGTGNFSLRFYEALGFGRVPLLVDTRCVLPLEQEIDWDARMVRVDAADVRSIADRLVDAHHATMADWRRSARALRVLWEEYLTQDGYFRHLVPVVRSLL